MSEGEYIPQSSQEIEDLVTGTEYEELFRDPQRMRSFLIEQLRANEDPMAREIGEGLADGTLTDEQLTASRAYADHLSQKMRELCDVDYTETANWLQSQCSSDEAARSGSDNASSAAEQEDGSHELTNWLRT